ncbi:unnamed protein product, partial [Schistosoma curassoni]|uniref:MIP-T3_C domain-containing protein n=1 Tax=Schistosoma curassoni TaxID=6186 RepID=A0A183L650_9TREM
MECPDNVGDQEDQSNNNGNEEIQLGSTGNQRNPLDPSWTTKAKYGRDATLLRKMLHTLREFQALQDLLKEEETTMEDNWKDIKEALTSTCQEVLGLKKHHHKEWISIET